nr:hypothetical protein Iba_chr06cCG11180 [Ipomoea batatas]
MPNLVNLSLDPHKICGKLYCALRVHLIHREAGELPFYKSHFTIQPLLAGLLPSLVSLPTPPGRSTEELRRQGVCRGGSLVLTTREEDPKVADSADVRNTSQI